jgi:Xaa-Pro dipeptidase
MKTTRRDFIKTSASAIGGLAVSGCAKRSVPQALSPMSDGIIPISAEERTQRIERARSLMQQQGIDAMFIESGSSMFYFTGIRWGRSERIFAWLLPADGEPAFICPAFEEEKVSELIPADEDVRIWEEYESPYVRVREVLNERGLEIGTLAFEETVRFFVCNGIHNESPELHYTSATPITAGCRMIKSPAELALMQRANDITIAAYRYAFDQLQNGMTQHDIAAKVADAFRQLGVRGGAYVQLGEYTAYPHGSRKQQHLEEGAVLLIDGGCNVEGYRSDISRTIVFGEPSAKQRLVWNLIHEAQEAALAVVKPGVACEDVDKAARDVITRGGFGPDYTYFSHRLGHGIGLDGHEWTYLVRGNKTLLQPGMCFSNEPGIYLYGEFGMRLEDCMYVTDNGVSLFSELSLSIEEPFSSIVQR